MPKLYPEQFREDVVRVARNRLEGVTLEQIHAWLTDVTEHRADEGKVYLCAVKDVWSNRIVGYSTGSWMKSRLAVAALDSAVTRRRIEARDVAGCILHSDYAEPCVMPRNVGTACVGRAA